MFRVINVPLPEDDYQKLNKLAQREFRRPRDQAGFLLVDAIERALAQPPAQPEPAKAPR